MEPNNHLAEKIMEELQWNVEQAADLIDQEREKFHAHYSMLVQRVNELTERQEYIFEVLENIVGVINGANEG